MAFLDVMRSVSESTFNETKKLKSLSMQIETVKLIRLEEEEEKSKEGEGAEGLSELSVFLLGLIAGAVLSVGFVVFVNISS